MPPILLATPRLLLRAARAEHAASLYTEYTSRADAARYLQRGAHSSQARTETVIAAWGENNWTTGDRFVWSVLLPPDETAIGLFLLFVENDTAEIHYGLGPEFWGRGLATEAGTAIMDWVVNQSSLSEVSTCCASDHTASMRVLDKIGLSRIELRPGGLLNAATGIRSDGWLYRWTRA